MYHEKLKQLTDKKLWLAPLAGYSDQAFRLICKDNFAAVVVSEMINAEGLKYGVNKSFSFSEFDDKQRPFGVQFFASSPTILKKAIQEIVSINPDFIDLNLGCPVRKIIGKGGGSALLKNPDLAYNLVASIKPLLNDKNILLSAKIRSGWDDQNINFQELGRILQDAGLDFITIHPRTKMQHYQGKSNWEHIKNLKETLRIPVIGNGDITSFHEAVRMYKTTLCDSVMIGRGAIGKPWIFKEINHFLNTGQYLTITNIEKMQTIKQHYQYALETKKNLKLALREMKPHFVQYAGSFVKDYLLIEKIRVCTSAEEIIDLLEEKYFSAND